ncbi:MAG: autotransporter-associated beta strand repeat-containing protein [Prolixibacteraceae bacterium]
MKRTMLILMLAIFSLQTIAQRKMETLDRGLVAVKMNDGVFLSWRIYGTEWHGVNYNIYRNGVQLNTLPLEVSNYTDNSGTTDANYTVTAIVDGIEQEQSLATQALSKQYKEITLKSRNTSIYEINDATAADLDGDGRYEIIVKRISKGWNEDNTNYSYFEAYQMDGTFMWEINVGPNILPDVEINLAAFDFDEDGKAEVFMRTSEGTIFGDGVQIGDTDNDGRTNYRYSVGTAANMQYMNAGPEFLSLIDGMTGAELDRVNFIPRGQSSDWGDSYGHRASKFFFGAPYLDGLKPSLFIGRGIYTKTIMRTYDIVNKKLQLRWEFNSGNSGPYFGQGNHNYTIADVDEDGRDEIVWGSMTVDDNGKGLYSTDLGHGDALHVGDLDPFRKGTEIFKCLENAPVYGTVLYDGATGEIIIHDKIDRDCGRCMAANVSDEYKGAEVWGGNYCYSATSKQPVEAGGSVNFRIFWDGDVLDELLDHTNFSTATGYGTGSISKFGKGNIFVANGAISCNYTKGTPSLQADLFGDWREEVIWRNEANTTIRIYTTIDPTIYRNYTLMHDHQYRQAICWQMCGYNQPPHVSYFLGEAEGMTVPPPPSITNDKLVYAGTGNWDKSTSAWSMNAKQTTYSDGKQVLFDAATENNASLVLNEIVSPQVLTVNSPNNLTLDARNGKLSGSMTLVKQGLGTFKLNGNHDFSGKTEIWNGSFILNGQLPNSSVYLKPFGKMYVSGKLKEMTMRYSALLSMGEEDSTGVLAINSDLTMEEGSMVSFDLHSPDSPKNDSLTIEGNFSFANDVTFQITPHLKNGENKLTAGNYLLATIKGDLTGMPDQIKIDGISGTASKLIFTDGKLYLEITEVRSAALVVWNGDKNDGIWDLASTKNFLNNGVSDIFVDQDQVVFNDASANKSVNIGSEVTPSAIVVDGAETYVFKGDGKISGTTTLTKNGTGTLYLKNDNDFSGKVSINEGTVLVEKMPTAQALGSIGAISSDPSKLEINGGILAILNSGNSDRAAFIGSNGGTIQNNTQVQWNEALAGGVLTKTGSGELVLAGNNTHSKTILQSGTLKLLFDETSPGKTISLEGGTLQCSDNSYSYNTASWNIEVPEGKTSSINLDGRCYYTGNITGSGTLNLNIPFVRTDFNGDMSTFSGNMVFRSSNGNAVELRLNHSKGLANALATIESPVTTSNTKGGTLILGALDGNGTLTGDESYQIGAKGIDTEFKGLITAGSLVKVGTGEFTLSNDNSYPGGTNINAGALRVINKSGSATGSGAVNVNKGGTLTGTGTIGGNVNVESGGIVKPGNTNTGNKLYFDKAINFKTGSILEVKVNSLFKLSDQLVVTGKISINGNLVMTNSASSGFTDGDEFKLFEASEIEGAFTSITPEIPGENMEWDISELNSSGMIKVVEKTAVQNMNTDNIGIYPNPVNDVLYIQLDNWNGEIVKVKIIDITGEIRISHNFETGDQNIIQLESLSAGVYFVKIDWNKQAYNYKIIKH